MQPGDTDKRVIRLLDSSGAGVTGKSLSDLTVVGYYASYSGNFGTYTTSAALTELAGGAYQLTFVRPSAAGFFDVWVTSDDGHNVVENHFSGETEEYDYAYLVSKVIRPVARVQDTFVVGTSVTLTMVADRYQDGLPINITDSDGTAIELDTLYSNYIMTIRDADASVTYKLFEDGGTWKEQKDAEAAVAHDETFIAVDDNGVLTLTLPEDAQFYEQITGSTREVSLYYDIKADKGGDASQTCPIIRSSTLKLLRREGGAS